MSGITYDPGDRVRLTEEYGGHPAGTEMVVERVDLAAPGGTGPAWPGEQILYCHIEDRHDFGVFARRVEPLPVERVPAVGDYRTPDGGSTYAIWTGTEWKRVEPLRAQPVDDGWHSAPMDDYGYRDLVAKAAMLGLEIRVQTRPVQR